MGASAGFAKLVLGALFYHFAAKLDERLEHLLEIENARLSVNNREVNNAKRRLHRRQLVELVEHDLRHRIALQLNHDSHTGAI